MMEESGNTNDRERSREPKTVTPARHPFIRM